MKYGIEFEYFVSKDGIIIPAYQATTNLDGNPLLGEIKTKPFDSILDCVFELDKLIYIEKSNLESKGYKMEIKSFHKFDEKQLKDIRKDPKVLSLKEWSTLEEFSIYPNNKTGKLLKMGEVKASLQISFSEHTVISHVEYLKVEVEDKCKYVPKTIYKEYSCCFNYVDILKNLDNFYQKDIESSKRVKGVYAIKPGIGGDRIEYRSLPNTINYKDLITLLNK